MPESSKLFLLAALSVCLALPASAAAPGFREDASPDDSVPAFDQVDQVAPLAVGAPTGLAMADVWVTINGINGDFHTDKTWCYVDELYVFGNFITPKPKNVTVSLDVKKADGTTAFHAEPFTAPPAPYQVLSHTFAIGRLETAGYYKIIYKVKQGKKVVGQSFWIQVQSCTISGSASSEDP
jgi:hypothetical protein